MNSNEFFLINERFDDLKETMNSGFIRIEGKLDNMDTRLGSLEKTRASLFGIGKGIGIILSAIVCLLGLFMYIG